MVATLCYGTNVNLVKYKLSDIKSIHLSSVTVAVAGISALLYLIVSNSIPHIYSNAQTHPWAFGAIFLLGAMGTAFAQVIFNNMLSLTSSVFASSITYFIPIVALLWGILDGEVLSIWHFLGMAFIIGGVFILNKFK
jgi:drug/metabolite transporter (DMT)-like permease